MDRKVNKKKHWESSAKKPRLEILLVEVSDFIEKNSQARVWKSIKRKEQDKVEPASETKSIFIDPNSPDRKVKIDIGLETMFKEELTHMLKEYADIFSWGPEDMPSINESITMHSFDVKPKKKPIK